MSLREAAKLAGKGKSTIASAIQSGRLAAGRSETGAYEIDPADLHRVFGLEVDAGTGAFVEKRTAKDGAEGEDDGRPSVSDRTARDADAEHRLALAEQEIRHLRETVERDREAGAALAAAQEAHLRDLRRELELARAMLPKPAQEPPRRRWAMWRVKG